MDLKKLGLRIRKARERLGLSQEDFAALISKTQTAVSEYENGNRKISITEIPLMAQILQVPILYFFEDELTSHDLDRDLLEAFHKIPEKSRKSFIEIVYSLGDFLRTAS